MNRSDRITVRLRHIVALFTAFTFHLAPVTVAIASTASGDLDGDGIINALDIYIEKDIINGTRVPSDLEKERGDVAPIDGSSDGVVGVNDLDLLIRSAKGEDVDRDGLAANSELSVGSSPFHSDTDGDGLSDLEEVENGSDPAKRDTDEDGINDAVEIASGLNPTVSDFDGDGIVDGQDSDPKNPLGTVAAWIGVDHLGSPRIVTSTSSELVRRIQYEIWGTVRSNDVISQNSPNIALDPSEKFTGQRLDQESGFMYYGMRYYDPKLGRFYNLILSFQKQIVHKH